MGRRKWSLHRSPAAPSCRGLGKTRGLLTSTLPFPWCCTRAAGLPPCGAHSLRRGAVSWAVGLKRSRSAGLASLGSFAVSCAAPPFLEAPFCSRTEVEASLSQAPGWRAPGHPDPRRACLGRSPFVSFRNCTCSGPAWVRSSPWKRRRRCYSRKARARRGTTAHAASVPAVL